MYKKSNIIHKYDKIEWAISRFGFNYGICTPNWLTFKMMNNEVWIHSPLIDIESFNNFLKQNLMGRIFIHYVTRRDGGGFGRNISVPIYYDNEINHAIIWCEEEFDYIRIMLNKYSS